MTYRKHSSTDGFIVLDIILALSLAAVFIAGMAAMSGTARSVFEEARGKKALADIYETHAAEFEDLMPGHSLEKLYPIASSSPIGISATARWYGDDRIETDIMASSSGSRIRLSAVRRYPYTDLAQAVGPPLCAPRFGGPEVGSYMYYSSSSPPIMTVTPIMLPIDPLLPLTDLIVRNGLAYISADSTTAADPDLLVVDVRSTTTPAVWASINTGPGIAQIVLAGAYVFAAAASTAAQFHVIQVVSPHLLSLARRYQLPLPEASTTPPFGSAITYDRGKVYLGTEKWDGEEFSVIDVSLPGSPVKIAGYETGSKVNDILVSDDKAYLAASDTEQLEVLDVAHLPSLSRISYLSPSGWDRQEGKVLSRFERQVILGRTSGGFNIAADKELFTLDPDRSLDVPGGIYGIVGDRDRLYTITRGVDKELSVFDRDLSTSTAYYYSLPVQPQAITCDLDKIYILAKTAPAIYEISFTSPH